MSVLAHPVGLDPLIAEAKQRARRRRLLLLVAAGLLAASAAGVELIGSGTGGGSGAVPWLPTKPYLGFANPPLAPPCTASQLGAAISVAEAAGSMPGSIEIVNRSSKACALVGRPRLAFGAFGITRWQKNAWVLPDERLAPPIGSLRALAPGRHVTVSFWWGGICAGTGRSDNAPRAAVLTAPGGGNIRLVPTGPSFPQCNVPTGPGPQVTRYLPVAPYGPRKSALHLKASILSAFGRTTVDPPEFAARAGGWLDFTVVLTNTSRKAFTFGRTCPAYTEGVGAGGGPLWEIENEAYILNCHGVGPIAPKQSVRFAMRVRVPAHSAYSSRFTRALSWTLAPRNYNASSALAFVSLR